MHLTTPLERQFAQIAGISQLTSVSGIGSTSISLQFDLSKNIEAAAQEVQAAINAAAGQAEESPESPDLQEDQSLRHAGHDPRVSSRSLPLTVVNDYADNVVAQQLSQVNGVGLVLIAGARKAAVRIEANPIALAGRGLGLEDIRAAVSIPKGTLNGPKQAYTLENNDQLTRAEHYRPIIVEWRNGWPVRLSDVLCSNVRTGWSTSC